MTEIGGVIQEEGKNGEKVDRIKNKDKFKELSAKLDVLARSRPQDKYALVIGL